MRIDSIIDRWSIFVASRIHDGWSVNPTRDRVLVVLTNMRVLCGQPLLYPICSYWHKRLDEFSEAELKWTTCPGSSGRVVSFAILLVAYGAWIDVLSQFFCEASRSCSENLRWTSFSSLPMTTRPALGIDNRCLGEISSRAKVDRDRVCEKSFHPSALVCLIYRMSL